MQNIIFYVAANETLAAVRDYANAKNATAPTLVRGAACCLKMRLFANSDGTEPYPMEDLSSVVSWSWAMDSDFDAATAYKLVGDNENITLASIEGEIDGEVLSYTEISIPMTHMNTAELAEWLGTRESQNTLAGELCGYDASGREHRPAGEAWQLAYPAGPGYGEGRGGNQPEAGRHGGWLVLCI